MAALLRHRLTLAGLALSLALAVVLSPVGTGLDRLIEPLRSTLASRAASGQTVIVEMDAATTAAIKRWPWPRDHYAKAVDALRRAGARSIAFDVDLSSPATPDGDRAFAAALARADGLVALPTFAQAADAGDRRSIDTLPIPILRDHVTLASVSVVPDADGRIRTAPFGSMTFGAPHPSLSAYIASRSGEAETYFPIDFGTDPASIPRLSFLAVRDGRFDPAAVRGRDVVIGATAIEMGDRYAVPRWGVLPGVVIQALAAETLRRGLPVQGSALPPLLAAALIALVVTRTRRPAVAAGAAVIGIGVLIGGAAALQFAALRFYPLAGALVLVLLAVGGRIWTEVEARRAADRLVDTATGLPNRRAMLADLAADGERAFMVVHVGNYEKLVAVLGPESDRDIMLRLADRLRLLAEDERVYRIADRLLALAPVSVDEETLAGLRPIMLHPIEVLGRRVDASVAVGLAEGVPGDAVLTDAAMAADEALVAGSFLRRASADLVSIERQISLMGELDEAIAAGQIAVHYQPKLSIANGRISSAEALVRWHHPVRGFVGPDLFIPLAEQTDRIAPLTLHVVERAMRDVAAWRAEGHAMTVAVNISAKLVADRPFLAAIGELLARRLVEPSALVFEVTESATLADPAAAGEALQAFRDLGIAVSMDDYGTGQSTLTYLRQLPLTELKIDRSFVQHAHRNRNDGIMVRSTVDLAHELGLKVVAEGIEDQACLDFLRSVGCDMAQGYLVSRPLTDAAFRAFIDAYGREQRAAA